MSNEVTTPDVTDPATLASQPLDFIDLETLSARMGVDGANIYGQSGVGDADPDEGYLAKFSDPNETIMGMHASHDEFPEPEQDAEPTPEFTLQAQEMKL